jgi:NAD(P)H dehydrogenase (quinone)
LARRFISRSSPVWNEGFPAILKGFFDRVFIPGVSFKIGAGGAATPNPQKMSKLAAVCTYGASRATNFPLGDPPKRLVKRLVRAMPGHSVRCDYLALYDLDRVTPEQRIAFLEKVKQVFETGDAVASEGIALSECGGPGGPRTGDPAM